MKSERAPDSFGTSAGLIMFNSDADLIPNGRTDIYDAIILAANFNRHVPLNTTLFKHSRLLAYSIVTRLTYF
jgi:hypothetical protein